MATERLIIEVRTKGTKTVTRNLKNIKKSASSANRTLALLRSGLVVVAATRVIGQFLELADALTNVRNRLRLVTTSVSQLNAVQARLFSISQETRSSFEGNAELFNRLARSTSNLGLSGERLLNITKTVNQAIAISGATAQEARNGLVQFSQGLAAGVLRGDELRSVVEQFPKLADIIAKEFSITAATTAESIGVTTEELKKLQKETGSLSGGMLIAFAKANDGALVTQRIIKALEASGVSMNKEFAKIEITVSGAFQKFNNTLTIFVGRLSESVKLGSALDNLLTSIGNNLGLISSILASILAFAVFSLLLTGAKKFVAILLVMGGSLANTALALTGLQAAGATTAILATRIGTVIQALKNLLQITLFVASAFSTALKTMALAVFTLARSAIRALVLGLSNMAIMFGLIVIEAGFASAVMTVFTGALTAATTAAIALRTALIAALFPILVILAPIAAAVSLFVAGFVAGIALIGGALFLLGKAFKPIQNFLSNMISTIKEAGTAIKDFFASTAVGVDDSLSERQKELEKIIGTTSGDSFTPKQLKAAKAFTSLKKSIDPVVDVLTKFKDAQLKLAVAENEGIITQQQFEDTLSDVALNLAGASNATRQLAADQQIISIAFAKGNLSIEKRDALLLKAGKRAESTFTSAFKAISPLIQADVDLTEVTIAVKENADALKDSHIDQAEAVIRLTRANLGLVPTISQIVEEIKVLNALRASGDDAVDLEIRGILGLNTARDEAIQGLKLLNAVEKEGLLTNIKSGEIEAKRASLRLKENSQLFNTASALFPVIAAEENLLKLDEALLPIQQQLIDRGLSLEEANGRLTRSFFGLGDSVQQTIERIKALRADENLSDTTKDKGIRELLSASTVRQEIAERRKLLDSEEAQSELSKLERQGLIIQNENMLNEALVARLGSVFPLLKAEQERKTLESDLLILERELTAAGINMSEALVRVRRASLGLPPTLNQSEAALASLTKQLKEAGATALETEVALRRLELAQLEGRTDASAGAKRAFLKFVDDARDSASAIEEAFTRAFQGAEDALFDFITTGKFNFKNLIDSMIKDIIRFAAKKAILGLVSGILPFANGGVVSSKGEVTKFAKGGLTSGPEFFPMANGGLGLRGEAGTEGVFPLGRDNRGRLGVLPATGGSGGGNNVEINIEIDARGAGVDVDAKIRDALGEVIPGIIAASSNMAEGSVRNTSGRRRLG